MEPGDAPSPPRYGGAKRKREARAPGGEDPEMYGGFGQKDGAKSAGALRSTRSDQRTLKSLGASGKVVKKGRGVVDVYSGLSKQGHILEDGRDVWQCMLNQTNIADNNNKFYVIQLIEEDARTPQRWWTFNRWGRIGVVGQSKTQEFRSLHAAKADFVGKFHDKTANQWMHRHNFVKRQKKYQLMDIDYGDDSSPLAGAHAVRRALKYSCKLDPRVRRVIELISDEQGMVEVMKELKIDMKRMPLGQISKKQLREAGVELTKIEEALKLGRAGMGRVLTASSQFYTLVPHDVGFGKTIANLKPMTTKADVARKRELLESLTELELSARVLRAAAKAHEHPLDAAYRELNAKLDPLPQQSGEWRLVNEYVQSTHGRTHNSYEMEVGDVLKVERAGEEARFAMHATDPGRTMLWHGSRAANWMGILSQGLRIAPPEASTTGFMFGKGVYFADSASKSAAYCRCDASHSEGLLLLSEVALGVPARRTEADPDLNAPPPGCGSVHGVGRFVPSRPDHRPADKEEGPGGARWPLGPLMDEQTQYNLGQSKDNPGQTKLLYNEYVVYDVSQIRARYLVRVKFHYKSFGQQD